MQFFVVAISIVLILLSLARRVMIKTAKKYSLTNLLLGNVLWLSLFLVLGLIIAEAYLRYFYDATDNFAIQTSAAWEARHLRFNNQGFRDKEFKNPKKEGVIRIGMLGDSFTLGQGIPNVDDRLSNILERLLNDEQPVEVYNLGVSGASTRDAIDTLLSSEKLTAQFDFDLLILVYVLNDIDDDIDTNIPDPIDRIKTVRTTQPLKTAFDHSYALEFFLVRTMRIAQNFIQEKNGRALAAYSDPQSWKNHQQTLLFLQSYARAANTPLLVVLFPFVHQLENYPAQTIHQQLRDFLEAHGVLTLDLLEPFSSMRSSTLVVNRFDAHPNERAHAIAAEKLAQFILDNDLLKEKNLSREDSVTIIQKFEKAWREQKRKF